MLSELASWAVALLVALAALASVLLNRSRAGSERARVDEERRGRAADEQHAQDVKAIEERREARAGRDTVDRANERIAARRRRGGALGLAVLLAAAPARAEDAPDCIRTAESVVCTSDGFDLLVAELDDADDARDLARADAARAVAKLDACRARVEALETEPQRVPWAWVGAGAAAGAIAALLAIVAVR